MTIPVIDYSAIINKLIVLLFGLIEPSGKIPAIDVMALLPNAVISLFLVIFAVSLYLHFLFRDDREVTVTN